ncbi:UV-B-induced protein At3g17800, chloroplastic isoform X1 [Ziziphus jujuba]|uniref:UV-B-induced protein At3g17800, chloroplastic isoform X1 n=1 Tax=Ziziphus jujuba TaxID=326968 RepID=A0A6P4B207_ZIZJJ|nr:UV-B-induced protein At3g17800, chloroplastic isoform X1 [Ziziphus jujuba]
MDLCVSNHHTTPTLPSALYKPQRTANFSPKSTVNFSTTRRFRPLTVIAAAGASHCEFSSLNSPLVPRSPSGNDLLGVLLNHPQLFHIAVADELKHLADDRDDAVNRMIFSDGSPEACLHRRIAKLKENECQIAVEDVMYLLIFYKFSELKVHLVPKLSRCIYNGRLEIWPSKDWELESIHSDEALEMIREHVTTVIGLRANASVKEAWATTKITRSILGRVYVASILYGYFLKSASSRLNLEQCLAMESQELTHRNSLKFPEICSYGVKHLLFGRLSSTNSKSYGEGSSRLVNRPEKLRCYVMGFDPDTLQRCAKLKSKEAMNLIENHSRALFGDETSTGFLESEEVILTSFSSLKRLVLEAVAFGSFIWETEDCVNTVYKLKEG